jgi:hypothetical protein
MRLGAGGAAALALGSRLGGATSALAAPTFTRVVYDDFDDGGASYFSKWFVLPIVDPGAVQSRNFAGGKLNIAAVPFTIWADNVSDHVKYIGISTQRFQIAPRGSVSVSAVIEARTPGTSPGHVVPTTGRVLLEGQQAAATLHLIDSIETGALFDWFISEHKAFALYERLFVGVGLEGGYTQITGAPNNNGGVREPSEPATFASQDFDISPGPHLYEIRYTRQATDAADLVEWRIDGRVMARVRKVGVPLDAQNSGYYRTSHTITYPSVGPGEALGQRLTAFQIAHGLFSLVDEFPFNQFSYNHVSIPREERIFGQGAAATFDDFVVTTTVID